MVRTALALNEDLWGHENVQMGHDARRNGQMPCQTGISADSRCFYLGIGEHAERRGRIAW